MANHSDKNGFESLNRGFNSTFHFGKMSIGLVVPIKRYDSCAVPGMAEHLERIQLAEDLGFSAVWLRDVPFNVPSFGDAGQLFDPFVYLGFLAAQTKDIALGVASIILPLRHPAHVAKSAASIDVLSGGRLIMGVASGDRPQEYPAMNLDYESRGERFADSFDYIRQVAQSNPKFSNDYGELNQTMDLLPKPMGAKLPLMVTGGSQQSPQWIAQNSDGWMIYPQQPSIQQSIVEDWQARVLKHHNYPKPVMQPLYFDLDESQDAQPWPIHLGFRSNIDYLVTYLTALERAGVNHVALNLRFNRADTTQTLNILSQQVLPHFKAFR